MSYLASAPSGTVLDPLLGTMVPDVLFGRLRRPGFRCSDTDFTQILMEASDTAPAVVRIQGSHYVLRKSKYLDINASGRNGIDAGTVAANTIYYLYAIPGEITSEFDLLMSLQPPSLGPVGFTGWSYLGAFATEGGTTVEGLVSIDGNCFNWGVGAGFEITISDAAATARTLNMPATARVVRVKLIWTADALAGDNLNLGPSASSITLVSQSADTVLNTQVVTIEIPVVTPPIIYSTMTDNADSVTLRVMGWQEDLLLWP